MVEKGDLYNKWDSGTCGWSRWRGAHDFFFVISDDVQC